MNNRARRWAWLPCALVACGDSVEPPTPPVEDASAPLACEPERGSLRVADVLSASTDPCQPWLSALVGRAVRVNGGSGSVWTRATSAGTGVMTTAGHVLSRCTSEGGPRDGEGNCPETITAPRDGRNLVRLTDASGYYQSMWSPVFALYNNFVPRAELHSPTIVPAHEVSVYVIDASTYEPWDENVVTPSPSAAPLSLHDPQNGSITRPTWAEPSAGARVFTLGYPFDESGRQTALIASAGRVLSDAEAAQAQQELAARNDEEGRLPYDPSVEFFLRGNAAAGMSGAGIFDEEHRQIGVLVRGSSPYQGQQYLRAVRMSYVVNKLRTALTHSAPEIRAAISPYLEADDTSF